jgi:tetratricopeptide (TPR) repeat protein
MASIDALLRKAKEARQNGDVRGAEARYVDAATLAGSEGAALMRAHALRHVAELAAARGDAKRALDAADEALKIYGAEAAPRPLDVANAHRVRALALMAAGRTEDSAQSWRTARQSYQDLGIQAGVAECDRRLDMI